MIGKVFHRHHTIVLHAVQQVPGPDRALPKGHARAFGLGSCVLTEAYDVLENALAKAEN